MSLVVPNWSESEEDHAFRSQAIQWVVHTGPTRLLEDARNEHIPRVIVQFWHDLASLPDDVAECLQSWRSLEPDGFTIRLFDDTEARSFIASEFDALHCMAFDRCYHPAMRCDYFRLCYILRYGGFYVDADEVYKGTDIKRLFLDGTAKLQPLCYDVATQSMVPPDEFLHDTRFPTSRIFYVNNNPILAPPGHALIALALQRATRLLLQDDKRADIQATTGPGNLSASLVRHVAHLERHGEPWDFTIVREWSTISDCRWFLSYRNDARNWRLASG